MNKTIVTAGLFILCLQIASVQGAGDMMLTLDDGRDVVLHEDSTWGFAKFTIFEEEMQDIYITVDHGRIICLKGDNTWKFVKSEPPKKMVREPASVSAVGTAQKSNLEDAVKAATHDAIVRTANRLKSYTDASKKTYELLLTCIKHEIGENGAEIQYTKGWNATAKISLDKLQSKKIINCVETQKEALAQKTASASAGAAPEQAKE